MSIKNQINIVRSEKFGEQYSMVKHSSGLDIIMYPMSGYTAAYACFVTKYGSIDTCFKTSGDKDFAEVPEGIAHFLEHKLFEGENGEDAFVRYAKTGANANAYTSFDRTAYLFSCTDNFAQSLEILLDFATHPYFTPETVQKEQGIIAQEIKMEEDNPDWRVFFNLLRAVYHNNPVRIDIAGTVDSISKIDADLLYRCYNTFYNLNNMVLVVSGNFNPEDVIICADKILKPSAPFEIERKISEEPADVKEKMIVEQAAVAQPLFYIGFKGIPAQNESQGLKNQILDELMLEVIVGETTPLYRKMYDEGIINSTFSAEVMVGRDYSICMMGGESRDPEAVRDCIIAEMEKQKTTGLNPVLFTACKKAAYGRYISSFSNTEAAASLFSVCHFAGVDAFSIIDILAEATIEQLAQRLALINTQNCAISIVKP